MSSDAFSEMQARVQRAENMKEEEKLYRYNGVLYPIVMSPEEHIKGIVQFQARPDDILLAAYPKCGESTSEKINDVK